MEDQGIIDLFFERSEQAITETDKKYGGYCYAIAYNILSSREDSEESVSDTYLTAWNTIPPRKPNILSAFLGKITRCISINRWKARSAAKRGGGQIILTLEELNDCIDGSQNVEASFDEHELAECLNLFLDSLAKNERDIFLRRYWLFDSIADIAQSYGFTQSKVTSMLHRIRGKLRKQLEREGFV